MDSKTCTMCKNEKHIKNFYKKYTESKDCNLTRGLKHYYENKDKISNQQKIFIKKTEIKYFYRKKSIDVYKLKT